MPRNQTKPKPMPRGARSIESDAALLDLPLREFCDTTEAAEILNIRYRSLMTVLTDARIRKVRIGGKCWLVLRSSLAQYADTRIPGRGRPRKISPAPRAPRAPKAKNVTQGKLPKDV